MQISDLMTPHVHCCRPQDTLEEAARVLWGGDCGLVPVVDEQQRVLGVLTDRDVAMAAYTQGRGLGDIQVGGVMSHTVRHAAGTDDIERAHELMREHQVRRVPVIDESGRLVGMLSLSDLAQHACRSGISKTQGTAEARALTETLAAVSRPRLNQPPLHALATTA